MQNTILQRIQTPDGKISYLFGTLHAGDERVVNLPIEVKRAFMQAERYAFEARLAPTLSEQIESDALFRAWSNANQSKCLSDEHFEEVYTLIKPLKPVYVPNFMFRRALRDKPPMLLGAMSSFGVFTKQCKKVL